ncbi:hypothetical protein QN277_027029 [Acacia crassicarpa]|uniref:Transmembrane protein n=1 Tax=Acacia crassicarpa TaxID=499986 RepID=A0AAE1JBL9_9FABA|nr:hypothetical protein QN277_027029 [Acacia crassicarpa]
MEGLRNVVRRSSGERSSSVLAPAETLNASGGGAVESVAVSSSSSSPPSLALASRPPRQSVSLLTCSKLCAICFVAGVVFGYTLKRRVKRWASKILKYLKE